MEGTLLYPKYQSKKKMPGEDEPEYTIDVERIDLVDYNEVYSNKAKKN